MRRLDAESIGSCPAWSRDLIKIDYKTLFHERNAQTGYMLFKIHYCTPTRALKLCICIVYIYVYMYRWEPFGYSGSKLFEDGREWMSGCDHIRFKTCNISGRCLSSIAVKRPVRECAYVGSFLCPGNECSSIDIRKNFWRHIVGSNHGTDTDSRLGES